MRRRDFLSALAFGPYSLIVMAEDSPRSKSQGRSIEAIREEFAAIAPTQPANTNPPSEPHMTPVKLGSDILVAGGGLAGVCAAVAAARHGAKVVLVQDRSRLGGNSSSEVKMHVVGANSHKGRPGWREGGLLEEFRLDDAANNPQRCWELWDLLLYDKVLSEPNITLLLDTVLYRVVTTSTPEGETETRRIERAFARCDKTEHIYEIKSRLFLDCTGDSRLGLEAGAEYRTGREARSEFHESLAPESADQETLGSSILFTSRKHDRPMPFTPPKWARTITKKQLLKRPVDTWEYGYWWIEWGGQISTIRDNERIRFELLSIVLGVWDYIKNSGNCPESVNWALDWVGMMPGKRGSRRLVGDHILTQLDMMGLAPDLDDGVAIGGWPMDDHPPGGFDRDDLPPNISIRTPVYNIPLRSLYSRNVSNLMMAGRNISATHAAFTSTRVMGTCAVIGQAVGTTAAMCVRDVITPRQLARDKARLHTLQQTLIQDDQTVVGLRNADPLDLARQARLTSSGAIENAPAANLLDGFVRDEPGGPLHRWSDSMSPDGAWIELAWDSPRTIRRVQITFDSGFQRELTLTSSDSANQGIIRAPQPETVRDYQLLARTDEQKVWITLAACSNNHQRLCRHDFDQIRITALRLNITATNGDSLARVFEIRCYG